MMKIFILLTSFMMLVRPNDCESLEVFITVAAKASVKITGEITDRCIQLNWYNANLVNGDWIGLFIQDPTTNLSNPQFKNLIYSDEGLLETKIVMPKLSQQLLVPLKKQCVGFWVAYVRDPDVLASSCFKIQPVWMFENYDSLSKMSLSQLMIPGTHDSGSFQEYAGWQSENILTKFVMTQRNDFYEQLVHGIRHLDIRIAYFASDNQFWLVHSTFRTNLFLPQLQNIKTFINATKEIVILDFHSFESGFKNLLGKVDLSRHNSLVSLLVQELGDVLIPRSYDYNVTLETLWKLNKRVIICYNDGDYYKTNEYLWPGLYQAWPNTYSLNDLKTYFSKFMSKPIEYPLWSAMGEFTEDAIYVVTNPGISLREMADVVNPHVTKYFREFWWDKANVVATDFFMGNNIIDVSIEANKKRAKVLQ